MPGPVREWYHEAIKRLSEHDGDAMVILRHAEREGILDPFKHELAMLTDEGRDCSRRLGACLAKAGLPIMSCYASPVRRCEETAELILEGHGTDMPVRKIELLGHIGPFIDDEEAAEITFRLMHMRDICNGLLERSPAPGFTDIMTGLKPLLDELHGQEWGGTSLVVTHDFFVASIAGFALDVSFRGQDWIHFVEPLLLLRGKDGTIVWFRGDEAPLPC